MIDTLKPENVYPSLRVAAVQAEPIYMNRDATIEKACSLIKEAGANGARLIAFPEVFVPGFPYWCRYVTPMQSVFYTKHLIQQAVQVPSLATQKLGQAAKEAQIFVVIGINEKVAHAHGTLYNTNLIFAPDGQIIGRHRKLVPTLGEKLIWANGDGEGLRVHETSCGRLGTLICGENANTLARFVLIAEGEQIHVANYPALPNKDPGGYNLAKDIEIRSAAHSFEGKVFTVTSSMIIGDSVVSYLSQDSAMAELMVGGGVGHTAVYGPLGTLIAGPVPLDTEQILYADVNLEDALLPKLRHDISGGYNRFDVMQVRLNRAPHRALHTDLSGEPVEKAALEFEEATDRNAS